MKVTVRVNEFKRVLEEARRVIPDKPIIPAFECVKIDVDSDKRATISSSELAMSLMQPFEVVEGDAGSFLLHAKKAYQFLKAHKGGTPTIEIIEKHIFKRPGKYDQTK